MNTNCNVQLESKIVMSGNFYSQKLREINSFSKEYQFTLNSWNLGKLSDPGTTEN